MRTAMQVRSDPGAEATGSVVEADAGEASLGDLRFRALLSETDWLALDPAIRRRFSKRVAGGDCMAYLGEVTAIEATLVGRLFAQAARLIGGPLPLTYDAPAASVVTVTEEADTGGQVWSRLYARRSGRPQVIHSAKRFAGPTGLEEHVGGGFGMTLRVSVAARELCFRSEGYFVELLGRRFVLPRWAEPGRLLVVHAELGDGRFSFTLELDHPFFGRLMRQRAVFREQMR